VFDNREPFEIVVLHKSSNPAQDRARALKILLQMANLSVFLALDNMIGGQDLEETIKGAIQECMCVIVILSDDIFNDGSYVLRELEWIFRFQKKVIPVFEKGFDFAKFSSHPKREVRLLMQIHAIEWHHNALKVTYNKVLEGIRTRRKRRRVCTCDNCQVGPAAPAGPVAPAEPVAPAGPVAPAEPAGPVEEGGQGIDD